jgi:hypothetical protein
MSFYHHCIQRQVVVAGRRVLDAKSICSLFMNFESIEKLSIRPWTSCYLHCLLIRFKWRKLGEDGWMHNTIILRAMKFGSILDLPNLLYHHIYKGASCGSWKWRVLELSRLFSLIWCRVLFSIRELNSSLSPLLYKLRYMWGNCWMQTRLLYYQRTKIRIMRNYEKLPPEDSEDWLDHSLLIATAALQVVKWKSSYITQISLVFLSQENIFTISHLLLIFNVVLSTDSSVKDIQLLYYVNFFLKFKKPCSIVRIITLRTQEEDPFK